MEKRTHFYGYKSVIFAIIVMIANYGVTAALPVFMPSIAAELSLEYTTVGMMLTVGSAVSFILMFPCGWVIGKLGIKVSMVIGMILVCVPCYIFASAKDFTTLIIGSAVQGLCGAVAVNVCISVLIRNWFLEKRGTLIGYAFCGSSIGSSFFLYLSGKLIETYSWQTAYIAVGSICLVIGVVFALFIKNTPEEMGQKPLGTIVEDVQALKTGVTMGQALRSAKFWALFLIVVVFNIFIMVLPTYAASLWTEAGMSIEMAGLLLTISTIACAVSTFFSGNIADRLGNKIYVSYLHVAYLISAVFAFLSVGTLNWVYIVGSLLALVIGIPLYTSMIPTISFELFGTKDYEKISGFLQAGINIGLMLMSPVCGMLAAFKGGFKVVYAAGFGVCLISLVIILLCLKTTPKAENQ